MVRKGALRCLALVASLLGLLVAPAMAQEAAFNLTTVLSGSDGAGFDEPAHLLAAHRFGPGWIVHGPQSLYQFRRDGQFVRSSEQRGQGPGEWGAIVWVAVRDDSVAVFDLGNARVSVLDSTLNVHRSFPFGAIGFDRALWLPDGRFVVTASFLEDPDRIGYAMAFLSPTGELSAAFDEYEMLPGVHSAERKRHLQLVGDTLVAISQNDGTVGLWTLSGNLISRTARPDVPAGWSSSYTETPSPQISSETRPPSFYLSALDIGRWRVLGIMTPREGWKQGFTDTGAIELDKVFRGSVQVHDKARGKVVADDFVDFLPVLLGGDYVVSPRADDLGFTHLEIRTVSVSQTR